jgi:hypothetical protein
MIFQRKKVKTQTAGQENSVVWTGGMSSIVTAIPGIEGKYQRRTQKGMGRTEKTGHKGAAKNPRWMKACNTTSCDICEFFFISVSDEICDCKFLFQNATQNCTFFPI